MYYLFFYKIANANVDSTGTIITSFIGFDLYAAKVSKNQTYTAHCGDTITHLSAFFEDVPTIGSVSYNSQRYAKTTDNYVITSPIDGYVVLRFPTTASSVMLNMGSEPLPYEPYGYKIPVVSRGKNLFDINNFAKRKYIDASGQERESTGEGDLINNHSEFIAVNPLNKYSLKVRKGQILSPDYAFCWFDLNKNLLSRDKFDAVSEALYAEGTYTAPSNAAYLIVNFRGEYYDTVMINIGEVSLSYEPYISPITTPIYLPSPLMADEVLDINGKRDVKWVYKTFDGSEDWILNSTGRLFVLLNQPLSGGWDGDANHVPNIHCTHFKAEAFDDMALRDTLYGISHGSTNYNDRLCIRYHDIEGDLSAFKSWLAEQYANGTPLTVVYPLLTSSTVSVDVPTIPTIKGNCVLDVDTEVQPTNMSAEYTKSIDFSKPVTRDYSFDYPSPRHTSEVKGTGDYDAVTGKYKIPVITSSENLFNLSTCTNQFVGTDGAISDNNFYRLSDYIAINSEVFISAIKKATDSFRVIRYDKDKNFISRDNYDNVNDLEVNDCAYIRINANTGHWDINTITVYRRNPFKTPIYLNTPLMADEILNNTGKRGVEWAVKVLDGSENWQKSQTYKGSFYLEWNKHLNPIGKKDAKFYCTHLRYVNVLEEYVAGTCFSDAGCALRPNDPNDDLSVFKSWVASEYAKGTPVTIYYQLDTPTSETVSVPEIPILTGNSIIDVDTEVKPANMSITYKKTL